MITTIFLITTGAILNIVLHPVLLIPMVLLVRVWWLFALKPSFHPVCKEDLTGPVHPVELHL